MSRRITLMTIAAFGAIPVYAHALPVTMNDVVSASLEHMQKTYYCRDVLGQADYRQARAHAENILRTTGIPAYVAVDSIGQWELKLRESEPNRVRNDLATCAAEVAKSGRNLANFTTHLRTHP